MNSYQNSIPKLLVVFDLDETLLFTRLVRLQSLYTDKEDFQINLGDVCYKVFVRPGAQELITYCQKNYEVGVWSSAKADYVQALTERLFDLERLTFIRHRDHCNPEPQAKYCEAGPIKDLKTLSYPIERILIVDDDPSMARRNSGNLIHVTVFRDNLQGNDLSLVLQEIQRRAMFEDVRF